MNNKWLDNISLSSPVSYFIKNHQKVLALPYGYEQTD
jgi:hypothetical protein